VRLGLKVAGNGAPTLPLPSSRLAVCTDGTQLHTETVRIPKLYQKKKEARRIDNCLDNQRIMLCSSARY
jgi:hypothetical protein